jgi:hypothetical protein
VAILKGVENAGQGGKRGHSNMDHWETTEEIKAAARKRRRLNAKSQISLGLAEREDHSEELSRSKPEKDITAADKSD